MADMQAQAFRQKRERLAVAGFARRWVPLKAELLGYVVL
jgi:hypothetical protein